MKSNQITTSAALYFKGDESRSVPLHSLERSRELFAEFNLSPILFTAGGGDFLLDDYYLLADKGAFIAGWGDEVLARRADLVKALHRGDIASLGLDSPRPEANDREDWRANVSVYSMSDEFYVGVDEELVHNVSALLRRGWMMAEGLFDVRYGFAYKLPLADRPDCYASGHTGNTFVQAMQMIRHRREWENRKRSSDERWAEELKGERRHLTGLFRGAYPASVLSESHVQNAKLASHRIGNLSKLNDTLWLWELSDAEIPVAQNMLESEGVLVSQASHE